MRHFHHPDGRSVGVVWRDGKWRAVGDWNYYGCSGDWLFTVLERDGFVEPEYPPPSDPVWQPEIQGRFPVEPTPILEPDALKRLWQNSRPLRSDRPRQGNKEV